MLTYCAQGTQKTRTCSGSTPKCGWSKKQGRYTCGTVEDADPAGTFPRECSTGAPTVDGGVGPAPTADASAGPVVDAQIFPSDASLVTSDAGPEGAAADPTTSGEGDGKGGCNVASGPVRWPALALLLLALAGVTRRTRRE
ncbi:MAG: hypothetical protein IT371_06260 [Deltaproteobacteria bacterium]|nr:hypothetical protein [Deltaproteobacteria bacterium]